MLVDQFAVSAAAPWSLLQIFLVESIFKMEPYTDVLLLKELVVWAVGKKENSGVFWQCGTVC